MPIPVVAAVAITAYNAYSSYRQTQISNAQKRAQARIAAMNAETAEMEGDLAIKASIRLESDSRRQTEQLIGMQLAQMSATGFASGEGSFANIIEMSAVLGEMDAASILYEGQLEKFRRQKEAESLRAEAESLMESQQNPLLSGLTGALSTAAALF